MGAGSAVISRLEDTIVAEATAPGRAALAIIRVSGSRAHEIGRALIHPWPTNPRVATLCELRAPNDELLDRPIVVRFDAPASFTGEDSVEITCHGGAIVPTSVLAALIAAGARQADPGEFTRRALFNGKLDLLQVEAIADLVESRSLAAQRLALAQLEGGLSRRLLALRHDLIGLEALIAYDIDFPEEDDGPVAPGRIRSATVAVIEDLDRLLATADIGEMVREGVVVVLAGVPNAGKSSLFNGLIGRQRAIVTSVPGTTRDAIEAVVELGRWPVRLVDTAGLRDSTDPVERVGVEVSFDYLERAAVVLACGAGENELRQVLEMTANKTRGVVIPVDTKSDLGRATSSVRDAVRVSSVTGDGFDRLARCIADAITDRVAPQESDAPILTRVRHRSRVEAARSEVVLFLEDWEQRAVPVVVAAVHLRTATHALEELVGRVDVENILDEVFARFCVGK